MKSNFTAIALISIAAFAGTNSFAGSGNDDKPALATQAVTSIQVATAPTPATAADFDPQINVRVGNEYPLFSA